MQNQVPVAKHFSTLSVRLWLVDWRGLTVSACYYLYSGALVFFFTQSCQICVKVAFRTIKQILTLCMCIQNYCFAECQVFV